MLNMCVFVTAAILRLAMCLPLLQFWITFYRKILYHFEQDSQTPQGCQESEGGTDRLGYLDSGSQIT